MEDNRTSRRMGDQEGTEPATSNRANRLRAEPHVDYAVQWHTLLLVFGFWAPVTLPLGPKGV